LLDTLKHKLDAFQIYYAQEILDFAKVFFKPPEKQRDQDQGLLHKQIDPAVNRFNGEPEERRLEFRHQLGTFLRLYSFLGQIVNFHDPDLERLYAFGRLLMTKLKIDAGTGPLELGEEVKLQFYRLSVTHDGSMALAPGDTKAVTGPTDVGTGRGREPDTAKLSEIVEVLNERFGTEFTKADQLWFDQIIEDMSGDETLKDQPKNNPIENFELEFDPKVMQAVVNRIERNENIASKFLTEEDLREAAIALMMKEVYGRLKGQSEVG
jgi:type I restriction enzyme R subunit